MFPSTFTESTAAETVSNGDSQSGGGIDFLFDYAAGEHIVSGFVLTECTRVESVRQYVHNLLLTRAGEYKVYTKGEDDVFGLTVYDKIGQRALPDGYLNSELKREVSEILLKHSDIADVRDWVGKREKRGLDISFTVVLSDELEIEINESILYSNYI